MEGLKKLIRKTEHGYDKVKYKIKDKLDLFKPVFIYPYRGFGSYKKVYLHGRILEKEAIIHDEKEFSDSTWTNIKRVWKRYESDEVPGVEVEGKFMGATATAKSDDEGYFTLIFEGMHQDLLSDGWHEVALKITDMPFDLEYEESATAEVLISSQKSGFGIISDIDDTIIESDILKPVKMVYNVLKLNERQRIVFDGVKELYNGLIEGFKNPLLFVSGSSYNLYDMLTIFCEHNNIPKAPFMMRDLGIGVKQWIKQDSHEYKKQNIEKILSIYPNLNFILIGDSGEKDPEIYLDIHQSYPGRVLAIYIRHVHSEVRQKEIEEKTAALDIPFLLMKNSEEAYKNAQENGWIK